MDEVSVSEIARSFEPKSSEWLQNIICEIGWCGSSLKTSPTVLLLKYFIKHAMGIYTQIIMDWFHIRTCGINIV